MKKKLNKAGHDLSDKPLSDIIPQQSLDKLKRKPVKLFETDKFEESFRVKNTYPEKQSQKPQDDDLEMIPASTIEAMLDKYSKDVEEDEQFYKQKIKDRQKQALTEKEEIKAITKDFTQKRPVLQDFYEPVKVAKDEKKKTHEALKSNAQIGGGFSNANSKPNAAKRKYVNNAITSTSVNNKINSRTAAQLDRLTNICIEASKHDMIINEMYANVKAEKKKNEELQAHLKPKKDSVKREVPIPNVPKAGLFSVDNWMSKIEQTDPKVLKDNIGGNKKLNVEKVSAIVDRLVKPATKNRKRPDPDQRELNHILSKYSDYEQKKQTTKKKAEYTNKLPGSRSSVHAYSQNSTKADNDLEQSSNFDNSDYSKYLLSNVHKEEAKLLSSKKNTNQLLSQSLKQSSKKANQNSTPSLSERIQTYSKQEDEGSDELNENVDFSEQEELPTFQINKGIVDNLQFMKDRKEKIVNLDDADSQLLSPAESQRVRYESNNSLNERESLNKDLKISEYSDDGDRDIDLEEQYNQMNNKIKEEHGDKSDDESINDVDVRYF